MKAQLNPFASYDTFQTALKVVDNDLKYKFPTISSEDREELASEAFCITHRFQEAGKLTIPAVAFAKMIARRKATDLTRRSASLRRQGVVFVDTDLAREIAVDTEGGDSEDRYDENTQFLLEQIRCFVEKQKIEMRQLFEADADAALSELTDLELAYHFDFAKKTATAVRKKRCDLKKRTTLFLASTPQYQHLQVVYRQRQVA